MKSRPSILIAAIFGILPILSCTNPIIEEIYTRDKGQNNPPKGPEIITVSGVSLNLATLELTIDGSTSLLAGVLPENATDLTVTWSSTDTTVAVVDDGLVTALAEGTATITVTTLDGGHTASCEVTVEAVAPDTVAVTGVSLNTTGLTLAVRATETLTAEIEPENATNQNVNWTSTNTDVATVDAATGVVTALGEGVATITVTTVNGGKTASCEVTVFVPVSGVSLLSTLTLPIVETETLTVVIKPENATNRAVTWASSDDLIVSVNSGIITALAVGRATIAVTTVDGNYTARCTVTVKERTGKADAPFLINNELELRKVGTGTDGWNLSAHYKLAADIILTQGDWTPIGDYTSWNAANRFTGSFNGNNKTITGLIIDKPDVIFQAMFGYIGSGGEVKNLTLVDCDIYGKNFVGGVTGGSAGTVDNCCVTGMVRGTEYVGGVAGENTGSVINSRVTGTVSGDRRIGGLVGYNHRIVENCYTTGDISGSSHVGGVVGSNDVIGSNKSTITNSYATGSVSGVFYIGGVAGSNSGNATVGNCYATGYVYGTASRVGGVVGDNYGTVENSHATGNVSGNSAVGGVVGRNDGTVGNCYATGNVSADYNFSGGVVGSNVAIVENCYATGMVSGPDYVGGVAGKSEGTVKNCVALNPNINSRDNPFGRIGNGGTMTNNYGRKDMKILNGKMIWTNNISGEDGEDITTADYQLQSWWSSFAGFDFGATWEWDNAGRLPVLKD